MIQPRTQTAQYWEESFSLEQADIDQLYNHLLEVEEPQTIAQLTQVIIEFRVAAEIQQVERLMDGRTIYQPSDSYEIGSKLVFPAMQFKHGDVVGKRDGYNPDAGRFEVVEVELDGKKDEFASALKMDHVLNSSMESDLPEELAEIDVAQLMAQYGETIAETISTSLENNEEFLRLGSNWFAKSLMADVNVGHLHLAEAVLEMAGGGPLPTAEITAHLDMDSSLKPSVLEFSLNYSLLQDDRFDEVAPKGEIAWFLRRLEPEGVRTTPERLTYTPIPHDRALLSPQLLLLERELDDEWSDIDVTDLKQPVVFTLLFPHRWAGTIPLSSRIRPLMPLGRSPHQRITFIDELNNEEIVGWIVQEGRYIFGLGDWYEKNGIPIGGFVHLKTGPKPGVLYLGFDKRRPQREWVRLATAVDNRIQFELRKRAVACGFDDLLIVGTDVTAAIDALWRRADANQRTVASLLAEIFEPLASLAPQHTVHAKTLYSAINMIRRMPPGPLFAELVRHQAFVPVGDHYWQFDRVRWRESNS